MPADPQRVESVFNSALNLAPVDRPALLSAECGDDAELRARVERLLAAHEELGDPPTADLPVSPDTATFGNPVETADHTARPDAGTVLAGRYTLVELVGEGGMGEVWMARQAEPVKRLVAVKLIKAGMDSRAVLARFEAERQALALMDHPNIAKVHDAGATPDGRPFFVMELVKGVPITQYCDEHKLTPRERLELFVPACRAIQHAHQKGVIHRDIKPSNVLVARYDDRPVPKVIDFGVAKATGPALTDLTLHTGLGGVVGTPEYMSPEQASLNNPDIDTRTDVYSLGVLLYELLAGSPPFSRRELADAGLLEILRVVREQEPPKPSAKLSTADGLATLSADRGTEPRRLTALLRGELDWVVMRCLEKDRARRYETANGLAADVERYLAGEPVLAHPASAGYRLRKFVRRNRGPVAAAGLVALALVAGMAGTTLGLVEAKRQEGVANARRDDAEKARGEEAEQRRKAEAAQRAEAEQRKKAEAAEAEAVAKEAEANAVVKFFEDRVFAAPRPRGYAGGLGHDVTLRDAVAASLPALADGFRAQPLVEARLRQSLGTTLRSLGDYRAAVQQLERVRAIYTERLGPDHLDTVKSMRMLAAAYNASHHPDTVRLCEEVVAAHRRVLPPDHPDTLAGMHGLASSYYLAGRPADAVELHREVLAVRRRVLPKDHPATLGNIHILAFGYSKLGRHAEAAELFEEALAGWRRVLPPDHPDLLTGVHDLAACYRALGRHSAALALFHEALAGRSRALPPDHPNRWSSLDGVAASLVSLNRGDEAIPLVDEFLTQVTGTTANSAVVARMTELRLRHFQHANDPAGCRATAEMWEKLNRPDSSSLYDAARYRAVAAAVYAKKDQPVEAAADADRAMAWLTKAVAAGWTNRAHAERDADLNFLRDRADFRKLLASLPHPAPPPREVKR